MQKANYKAKLMYNNLDRYISVRQASKKRFNSCW